MDLADNNVRVIVFHVCVPHIYVPSPFIAESRLEASEPTAESAVSHGLLSVAPKVLRMCIQTSKSFYLCIAHSCVRYGMSLRKTIRTTLGV